MLSLSGSFLVAQPVIRDPHFCRSVVLLLQHSKEGALGLVVNQPRQVAGVPFPVFLGGPCQSPGLLLLHGHAEWLPPGSLRPEVAPGIFLGDAECLRRVSESPPPQSRFRVFIGYAGWGPGQLETELALCSWAVIPARGELLFDTPVEQLWDRLLPPLQSQPSPN